MTTTIRHAALALLFASGAATSAQAGVLTYQNVTFSSTWNANVLTLEIDAAHPNGDWSSAIGLEAVGIKDIGNYTGVSVTAAPNAAPGWALSPTELNAKGCSGTATGQAGSRLCFSGNEIALSDGMVFSFAFTGNGIAANDPHVKVEFVDATGADVGSLLSQTLLPGTAPQTPSTQATSTTTIPTTTVELPSSATSQATLAPINPSQQLAVAAASQASVAEPWTPALMLGGLALIGMTRRRKNRKA